MLVAAVSLLAFARTGYRVGGRAGPRGGVLVRRGVGQPTRRRLGQRARRHDHRRDLGERPLRRRALLQRHERPRLARRPRHLLPAAASRSRPGCRSERDQERRGRVRHLDRQRPDALGRPHRDPLPPHARQQPRRPTSTPAPTRSQASGSTSPRPSTAPPRASTSTAPQVATRTVVRQRRQLRHVADRRLRQLARRLLRRPDRRRPRLRAALSPPAEIQTDMNQPVGDRRRDSADARRATSSSPRRTQTSSRSIGIRRPTTSACSGYAVYLERRRGRRPRERPRSPSRA